MNFHAKNVIESATHSLDITALADIALLLQTEAAQTPLSHARARRLQQLYFKVKKSLCYATTQRSTINLIHSKAKSSFLKLCHRHS